MALDIATEFKGADAEVVKALSDPKVAAALETYVTTREAPLVAKRDELLGSNRDLKTFIDTHGGQDRIKTLADTAAKADEATRKAAASSSDVETVRSHMTGEIKARDTTISKLLGTIKDGKVKSAISTALSEAGGDEKLLGPHIATRVKSDVNDAGDVTITVLKADGNPWLVGTEGKAATLADLLGEMKTDASLAKGFSASGARGSGAAASSSQLHGIKNPWMKGKEFNLTEQTKIMLSNPDLAKTLAAAAQTA